MTDLSLLDSNTLHGLMRSIMQANFNDAMRMQQLAENGLSWNDTISQAKNLEISLSSLCSAVHNAMVTGELSPFGGYKDWLVANGYIDNDESK